MIILVADDDRLVRFTIKSMLADIMNTGYTVLEAANGRDMVKICREKQPDIVFVDINMPYISGLDAIVECKKYAENTEYVIVSGYSEFEYARRGISLGIQEYLLKPVSEEQLEKVMNELKEKMDKHKKESNSAFQLKLLDLFNYFPTVVEHDNYEEFKLPQGYKYIVFGLFVNGGKKNEVKAEIQKRIISEVSKLEKKVVDQGDYYALVYSNEGTPYFIFAVKDEEKVFMKMRHLNMAEVEGTGAILLYFRATTMKGLYEVVEDVDKNSVVVMNYKSGMLLEYHNMIQLAEEDILLLRLIGKLLEAWRISDGVAYKEILNEMYRKHKDRKIGLNLQNIARYCSWITGKPIEASSYKAFCRSFVDISESMYIHAGVEEKDIIEQVKGYIQKYYMNDISISQLADQYNLTANYLSTIFHHRAGCKFIDYLTEIRITNAKKLLVQNTTASVQDIAMMVGYNSSRHFSALFQKQTGMTPTKYRKSKS